MPIYEYSCPDCGARFDALRSMKEADAPIACKQCQGDHAQRKLSVFFAKNGERAIAGTSSHSGCGGCSGGSCGSCHH